MAFEFDFFRVGESSKAGDAILLRFGDLSGNTQNFNTILIDGGTKAVGKKISEHLIAHYNTTKLDMIISTHPDGDHIAGIVSLMEDLNIDIGSVVMNRPWLHVEKMSEYLNDGRITENSFVLRLRKAFRMASDVERLAKDRGIDVVDGFEGFNAFSNSLHILGPSEEHYKEMLMASDKTPEMSESLQKEASSVMKALAETAAEAAKIKVKETLDVELLENPTEYLTSFINNTSIIMSINLDKRRSVLTGDAGVEGLDAAFEYAEMNGIGLSDLFIFQIPHHGSRRNIGPALLDRISGKRAVISSPKKWDSHPSKMVINALIRRNWEVYCTSGSVSRFHHGAPDRDGYDKIKAQQFFGEYYI